MLKPHVGTEGNWEASNKIICYMLLLANNQQWCGITQADRNGNMPQNSLFFLYQIRHTNLQLLCFVINLGKDTYFVLIYSYI